MRGLYIVVEGQTEEEFVRTVMQPYYTGNQIYDVRPILIGKTGGAVTYQRYKNDVQHLLNREADIIVTTLVDFFRLSNDFPGYQQAMNLAAKDQQVAHIEQSVAQDINHSRFIPYIQLHEFEGLLFTSPSGFQYVNAPAQSQAEIAQLMQAYPNPEMINDGVNTAPSKRLLSLIPGYKKTLHGPLIAAENGIGAIMSKCPRFKSWSEACVNKMSTSPIF